ncbi:cytochrome P450 [Obba rivulosa]|uniref:Cytochrome P450 n=1 Tax=Obba rivulosa TaxID=1052685 RepID=A0A8E2APB3_9APHY|nr:cytochrome P450 [Obba rivulosa]
MHPDSQYRLRLLKDLVCIFVTPAAVLSTGLRLANVRLGILVAPAYVLCTFAWVCGTSLYFDSINRREAQRLGARPIPQVVGKWPGNVDILLRMLKTIPTSYYGSFYLSLFEEYHSTTLNLKLLWRDMIITMDSEHSKYILSTGFSHFWRGRRQKERFETFLGEGIFNRDDQVWKTHRALARPFFARDRITDFETFEKYTHKTLTLMSSLSSAHKPIEVQDLYARFTLDAASEFLFGQPMDTLSGKLPVAGQTRLSAKGSATEDDFGSFAQAFEAVQTIVTVRARRGYFWPVWELPGDEALPHVAIISRWLEPVVQRALANKSDMKSAGLTSSVGQGTFLEYLADQTEDPKVIQDQLLNILLASRDTTATLLTYATYFLAEHPEVLTRLRAEVIEHCGTNKPPTFENIKAMRYLRAVINETLRLFPPVPLNTRESRSEPCVFPKSDRTYAESEQPLYVPANTLIMTVSFLQHRNPALWGPDADVFDPDRWLDARLSRFTANPLMYTPFSAGPRICIGQNYALNEASCFLARLLQQFDSIILATDAQPAESLPPPEWKRGTGRQAVEKIWPGAALTAYIKGGLWVRFMKVEEH